eukprot:1920079-Pyramimonas_sp.AAC.1
MPVFPLPTAARAARRRALRMCPQSRFPPQGAIRGTAGQGPPSQSGPGLCGFENSGPTSPKRGSVGGCLRACGASM